jgi:hypothetical protein|tara:strand:- start:1143 stop:1352 length:210 start_codon:yes stop_codon:yes gene_type:complete
MAARYQRQMNIALERLDQGLATLYTLVKRGQTKEALHYMDEGLKEKYENLENIINIEPDDNNTRIGHLR